MAAASTPFTFVAAANASISQLVVTPDRWILRRFNDTAHLDTDLDAPARRRRRVGMDESGGQTLRLDRPARQDVVSRAAMSQ